jgi:nucleotide-binding universal stress UspA family protein
VSNSHVTLAHAIIPSNSFPIEAGAVPYDDRESIDKDARALLYKMALKIEAHGIECDVDLRHGFASDAVREALKETGATELIMGTHGRGKLGQFALGSVANELLKTVDAPIFAVGPRALTSPEHAAPRKILHPVSLDGECQRSVDFAIDVAQIYGAELTLLHVLSPDARSSRDSERTLNWAKNAMLALTPQGVTFVPPIQAAASCGKLVEEILRAADRTQADWIVLGVDGDYPMWSLKDSTAYKVLAAANCPVFAIRHDSRAGAGATARADGGEDGIEARLADVSA